MQILVAEDDRDIAQLIAHYMAKAGWHARIAASGDEALAQARDGAVDLLILDLMLPGVSGLEVCRLLRADRATAQLPIIMVTARAEETDRVFGLEIGADDYISKPFSPNELVARIRALMRRSRRQESVESALRYGPLVMDLPQHRVTNAGQEVKLTAKEFMLLQYLLEHRGRVLSRDLLRSSATWWRTPSTTRRKTGRYGSRRLTPRRPA